MACLKSFRRFPDKDAPVLYFINQLEKTKKRMPLLLVWLIFTGVAGEIRLEAEDGELLGVAVDSTLTGYSGRGYVTGFDAPEDSVRFSFEAPRGVYRVVFGVSFSSRFASYALRVDDWHQTGSLIKRGGGFFEASIGEIWLDEGAHTMAFQLMSGALDYVRLEPVSYGPPARPPAQLSDSQATASAQALFAFLLSEYGRHILAGQQQNPYRRDFDAINYVRNVTGKEPALVSFDLIDYSPSREAHGVVHYQTPEDWIAWAGRDGIVSLMWHWNAPTDLIEDPSQDCYWWYGFYTRCTTFDVAAALADTSSERYRLLLRDIDVIAAQLQKFQQADIPVLWRPLHEAAGGWFWWGAKGPEPFKQLWRLLYERLVHHHGLHNLIWVYTHEPGAAEWYPGDAYVDIVGRDVYADDPDALMRSDWDELQTLFGGRKLVALTETGTLPDVEVITDYGIWWSWFSIWTDPFLRDVDPDRLTRVYHSERVLTRDELPDWRSYVLHTTPVQPAGDLALAVYPNPGAGRLHVEVGLSVAAPVVVEVFNLLGQRVLRYQAGMQPAGFWRRAFALELAPGVYLVQVRAGNLVARRRWVSVR